MSISSGNYGDFKTIVSALKADRNVFYTLDAASGISIWAFPDNTLEYVHFGANPPPSTFNSDFPHAVELNSPIQND